ncbi:MAG: 4Fe-4S binding protein [Halobacteria archaeon]
MTPSILGGLCTGCWGCVEVCPTGALTAEEVPRVAGGLCVSCGACLPACPTGAVSFPPRASI